MIELHKIWILSLAVACPIIFILFYDRGWRGGVFIVIKIDHFLVFLAVWVFSPQVFRQVEEWPILELHEMIRVLHAIVCPFSLILFYGGNWQGGVLRVINNDYFFVFLPILFFRNFLGRLKSNTNWNC